MLFSQCFDCRIAMVCFGLRCAEAEAEFGEECLFVFVSNGFVLGKRGVDCFFILAVLCKERVHLVFGERDEFPLFLDEAVFF